MSPGPSRILSAALAALAAAFLVLPRLSFVRDAGYHIDVYMMATSAARLLDGAVLYRDIFDNRSPLYHYWFECIAWLGGRYNLAAVNAALVVLVAGVGVWVYLLGSAAGGRGAAVLALLFFALTSFNGLGSDLLAHNAEWLMVFWTAAGSWLWMRGWACRHPAYFAASGLCFGLAVFSKQPALVDLAAPALCLAAAGTERARRAEAFRWAAWMAAGLAAVALAWTAFFAAQGALSEYARQVWGYSGAVATDIGWSTKIGRAILYPLRFKSVWRYNWPVFWTAVLFAAVWLPPRLRGAVRKDGDLRVAYLIAWAAASYAAASLLSGRNYGRYYIQTMPAFCVLAGLAASRVPEWFAALSPRRAGFARGFALAALFVSITALTAGPYAWEARRKPDWRLLPWLSAPRHVKYGHEHERMTESFRQLVSFLRSETKGAGTIYVWGFVCEVYVRTGLEPASRFIYFNPLSGVRFDARQSIPAEGDLPITDPESWKLFLADLERSRPAFVIDATAGDLHYDGFAAARFEPLRRLLESAYRLDRVIGPAKGRRYLVYRRVA